MIKAHLEAVLGERQVLLCSVSAPSGLIELTHRGPTRLQVMLCFTLIGQWMVTLYLNASLRL